SHTRVRPALRVPWTPAAARFSFTHAAPSEPYTLSLHDALPISAPSRRRHGPPRRGRRRGGPTAGRPPRRAAGGSARAAPGSPSRSEEHTSELQSPCKLVCRLLLEKKKTTSTSPCCTGRSRPTHS